MSRGSGKWTELTLDGLNKLMMLVEERLFPGDELAAAMSAAVGGGSGGAEVTKANALDDGVSGLAGAGGGGGGGGGRSKPPLPELEGSWGEDGTAAGALNFLVECMLEVRRVMACCWRVSVSPVASSSNGVESRLLCRGPCASPAWPPMCAGNPRGKVAAGNPGT